MKLRTSALACAALLLAASMVGCTPPTHPIDTTATPSTSEETAPTVTEESTEGATESGTIPETDAETDANTQAYVELIVPKRTTSKFKVICDYSSEALPADQVGWLCYILEMETGVTFRSFGSEQEYSQEIVLGSAKRPEMEEMMAELQEGYFAIRAKADENNKDAKIFIAAHSYHGYRLAFEYLLDNFYTPDNNFAVPADLNVTEYAGSYNLITSSLLARDPCIVVKDGVYYAYRTGWGCLKNTSGNLEGPWEDIGLEVQITSGDAAGDHWAPEVHEYKGSYYMICSPPTEARSQAIADAPF